MAPRSLLRAKRDLHTALPDPVASPVIKWVGGKTKLLSALTARMPAHFERYFEPFAGGAALFFRIAPERAVLTDSNHDLIGLYTCLTKDVAGVIRTLEHHRSAHSEAHYYETRTRWNDRELAWTSAERAATFIYLNKTCFNGLWRVNRSGAFNVPIGRYVDPPICAQRIGHGAEPGHPALRRLPLRGGRRAARRLRVLRSALRSGHADRQLHQLHRRCVRA
ncbi:MAG: Dam family site-specific DNA-(adenine-N6)-methyltransferase [Myxococcales bacterium]|nr:Dam family site-specific DNA-(adenine-N6)-methyltransferase [Myxococcales bacterium]